MPGCFSRWQLLPRPRRRSWQRCARSGPAIEDTARRRRQLVDRPKRLAEGYARDYLDALSTELNRVEIIGLTVDEPARGGELEVAYLSLNASIGIRGERRRIDFATLLTLLPKLGNRILIEGPAGAGKSTLLRWAAIQAARYHVDAQSAAEDPLAIAPDLGSWLPLFLGEAELPPRRAGQPELVEGGPRVDPTEPLKRQLAETCWRTRIPFFIPLRRTKQPIDMERLPKLACSIGDPPGGWIGETIRTALLLIDGVDEVPFGKERREALKGIENWAKQERFSNAQIVITSRPGAVPDDSLAEFERVQLDELDDEQKPQFISHWHRSLAAQLRWSRDHPVIQRLGAGVLLELERQRALNGLAANPLLCASLCALHWDRRREATRQAYRSGSELNISSQVLPGSLWRVCDALTDLLLERREKETPDLDIEAFPAAYRLTPDQKRTILARLAWGMAEDDMRSTMRRTRAEERVQQALEGIREKIEAPLGRSSRPCWSAAASCAPPARMRSSSCTTRSRPSLPRNVTCPAASHQLLRGGSCTRTRKSSPPGSMRSPCSARPVRPDRALPQISCGGWWTKPRRWRASMRPSARGGLRILAVRCETVAGTDLKDEDRQPIRAIAPGLFPPRSMDEARQLAALGEDAVAWLGPVEGGPGEEAAASVRCLRLIGGAKADAMIEAYTGYEATAVLEELSHVRDPLTLPAIIRATQAPGRWWEIPQGIKSRITDAGLLAGLPHLAKLANLQTIYLADTRVSDAGLPHLAKLTKLELALPRAILR